MWLKASPLRQSPSQGRSSRPGQGELLPLPAPGPPLWPTSCCSRSPTGHSRAKEAHSGNEQGRLILSRGRVRGQRYHQDRLAEVWASPPPTQPGLVSPRGKAWRSLPRPGRSLGAQARGLTLPGSDSLVPTGSGPAGQGRAEGRALLGPGAMTADWLPQWGRRWARGSMWTH